MPLLQQMVATLGLVREIVDWRCQPCGTVMLGNKILGGDHDRPRPTKRIDEFLPISDVSASYENRINAPPSVVYQRLLLSDFNEPWVVRLLMTLRSGGRPPRNRAPGDLPQRLQGTGFVILEMFRTKSLSSALRENSGVPMAGAASTSPRVILSGFLVSDTQRQRGISGSRTESPKDTVLSTETRIKCFGRAALWKFRTYWSPVSPFSGLIRKAILKQVKTEAESTLTEGFLKIVRYRNSSSATPLSTLLRRFPDLDAACQRVGYTAMAARACAARHRSQTPADGPVDIAEP